MFRAPATPIKPFQIPPGKEVVEIITGGMVKFPDASGREFRRGTVFWHQPGEWTINHTTPSAPYRCLVCHFATDNSPRQVPRVSQWSTIPDLGSFVDDMLFFASGDLLKDEKVFYYCLGTLLRQTLPTEQIPVQLQKVCRKLNNNPAADPPVKELAEYAGLSSSRLFALFREYLHSSPHKYLLQCRLNMAKELLRGRLDLPIKQICEMCGFTSLEVFYRRFRRYIGCTPGEFRRNNIR